MCRAYGEARHIDGPVHVPRGIRLCSHRRKRNHLIPHNLALVLYNRRIDGTCKWSVDPTSQVTGITESPPPNASEPLEFRVNSSPKMG